MQDTKLLVGLDEAAEMLSLSVWTMRAWAQRGIVKTVRVGGRRLMRLDDVRRIAAEGLRR